LRGAFGSEAKTKLAPTFPILPTDLASLFNFVAPTSTLGPISAPGTPIWSKPTVGLVAMTTLGDDLLGTVNKLQDLVFNTIGNDSLDLPQIVSYRRI
jgi:hypothetical protein